MNLIISPPTVQTPTFTSAELAALGSARSAFLRRAICSDCYTSIQTTPGAPTGGTVRWSDGIGAWITDADSVPATNDFAIFAANMVGFGSRQNVMAPVYQSVGLGVSAVGFITSISGGLVSNTVAQSNTTFAQSIGQVLRFQSGATAGNFANALHHSGSTLGSSGRRRFAVVAQFLQCQAIGADDYTWQMGVRTRASLGSSTPANLWSLGFDPANKTGCNPGTSNLAVLTRTNSTAVSASGRICNLGNSTVTNTTPAVLVVTMEPTGTTSARMRAIVLPYGNLPTTQAAAVVDETWTPSATDFEVFLGSQKTTGTTTNFEAYFRSVGMISWADNALPSTIEADPILSIVPAATP